MAPLRQYPVPVAPLGRVVLGNVLREAAGERRLAIYVKACFKLAPGGSLTPIAPDPIRLDGTHPVGEDDGTAVVVVGAAASAEAEQQVGLLSSSERSLLDVSLPVGPRDMADDAPVDGPRVAELEQNEWLVLAGMGQDGEPLKTQLPGVVSRARVWADAAPVDLRPPLRTMRIDRERGRCTFVWSTELSVPAEGDPGRWLLAATLALPSMPYPWPARSEIEVGKPVGSSLDGTVVLGKAGAPDEKTPSSASIPEGTVALSQTQAARAGDGDALPFATGSGPGSRPGQSAPIPGAPWSDEEAIAPPAVSSGHDATVAVSSATDELRAAQQEAARRQREAREAADAEQQRLAKLDEERKAAAAAQEAAAQEAAERRAKEEEAFRKEQEEAERAEAERARQEAERRKAAGKKLRTAMYGSFKKKS